MPFQDHEPASLHTSELSWLKKITVAVAVSPLGRWLVPNVISPLDIWLSHASRGSINFTKLLGFPVLILTTTGMKTGKLRETPLIYLRDEDEVVVIASSLGSLEHPHWYRNLILQPQASLFLEGKQGKYSHRLLEGQERQEYWQRMLDIYPGYNRYAELADGREIPVILFTPISQIT